MKKYYATVGTDGTRPVVWGLGDTEADARHEAKREIFCAEVGTAVGDIIGTVEIDEARAERIQAGDVDASDLVERFRLGSGGYGLRVKVMS